MKLIVLVRPPWQLAVTLALLINLVQLTAQSAASLYQKGLEATETKDYENAKKFLFQTLQLKAEYPEAFLALGEVFESLGDDNTALKSYGSAIVLDNRIFEAYFSYRAIAMKRNNPQLAWQVYSRIIQLDAKNAKAYARRGDVLLPFVAFLALLDYDKAIEYTKNEAELARLHFLRGNANLAQRCWQDAQNDYKKSLQLNDESGLVYIGLGRSQLRQQKYKDAQTDFSKAKRYENDNPYIYVGLATVEVALGRQKPARKYFEEAVSTEISQLYWRKAQFEQKFGQMEAAEANYNKAMELDTKDFEAHQLRGAFYQWQGRYQEALADYRKGISLLNANLFKTREGENLDETELLLLFQYRGDVQLLLGEPDAAIKNYQTLLKRGVENSNGAHRYG